MELEDQRPASPRGGSPAVFFNGPPAPTITTIADNVRFLSFTFDEHLHNVCLILERIQTSVMKVNFLKYHFIKEGLKCVGHIVRKSKSGTGLK